MYHNGEKSDQFSLFAAIIENWRWSILQYIFTSSPYLSTRINSSDGWVWEKILKGNRLFKAWGKAFIVEQLCFNRTRTEESVYNQSLWQMGVWLHSHNIKEKQKLTQNGFELIWPKKEINQHYINYLPISSKYWWRLTLIKDNWFWQS